MTPAMLFIDFRAIIGSESRTTFLFDSGDLARAAQEMIAGAAKAYHDRANDRERLISFATSSGQSTVDVSDIHAIGVDDALGMAKPALEAWNAGVAEMQGKSQAIRNDAAGIPAPPSAPKTVEQG